MTTIPPERRKIMRQYKSDVINDRGCAVDLSISGIYFTYWEGEL